jgi:hypothetical protein
MGLPHLFYLCCLHLWQVNLEETKGNRKPFIRTPSQLGAQKESVIFCSVIISFVIIILTILF